MSINKEWISQYLNPYQNEISKPEISERLLEFYQLCLDLRDNNKKLMVAGNGASASIASHFSVDFSKQGKVRAINFNEANLITCFSNDYGYENWITQALKHYGDEGDIAVLISSSGKSPNVVNAGKYAKEIGMKIVTFTGFANDNPLKTLGDLNFWVNSKAYNIIECIHMIWGTAVIDMLVGKAEYSVS